MELVTITAILVAGALGGYVGRQTAPKPPSPPPAPKFGLNEAEAAAQKLGSALDPQSAKIMVVVSALNGAENTVAADVQQNRQALAAQVTRNDRQVAGLQAKIQSLNGDTEQAKVRDSQVAAVGTAFGLGETTQA